MCGVGLNQVIQDGAVEGVIWVCAGGGDAAAAADEIEKNMGRRRNGQDPEYC